MRAKWTVALALMVLAGLIACGLGCSGLGGDGADADDDEDYDDDEMNDDDASDDDASGDDDSGDDDSADDDDDIEPPDPEEESDLGRKPVYCDGALYVPNTGEDYLSRIDSQTLAVTTIEVGRHPEVLRATDDCSALLTLNTGDDTLSVIDTNDNSVSELDLRPGLNRLDAAPGARYALAYHHYEGGDKGFFEVSIADIAASKVSSLAIGFSPDSVLFTVNDHALLASEVDLALIGLADSSFVSLPSGINVLQGERISRVKLTADGRYALIMVTGSTVVRALDLSDYSIEPIELGCYATDLDVASQGDCSLIICREEGRINVLDNQTLELTQFTTDEVIGSGELTADGSLAVLFTNAQQIERVHLLDVDAGELRTFLTLKPLSSVAIAPGDTGAVLFHQGGDGEPIDPLDEYFDRVQAFSVMNFDDGRINTVEVPQKPTSVSFDELGRYGIVPLPTHKKVALARISSGIVDLISSPSKPVDAGVIAADDLAYVLQDHPLGRISFVDATNLQIRTITGFLLNGEIEP
ncbi:MAG: hypothetical protein P9M14_17265 [Candidatus Alcyoniella australis]|nr:hypothetical protein [Candidatus Alcyoniella australis]